MFDNLKKELYFKKMNLLYQDGLSRNKIIPFDEEFYDSISNTFIGGLPVSIHIKYLRPIIPPGKCYERSLYMFFCFDDALLVRGNIKNLELKYGKENSGHGWIEKDGYVYDPTSLLRYEKELYYDIYNPKNITRCNIEEYCKYDSNKELYEDIKNTTIDSYKTNFRKKMDLLLTIPLIEEEAKRSNDKDFINDLFDYINKLDYNPNEISIELNEKIKEKQKSLHFN